MSRMRVSSAILAAVLSAAVRDVRSFAPPNNNCAGVRGNNLNNKVASASAPATATTAGLPNGSTSISGANSVLSVSMVSDDVEAAEDVSVDVDSAARLAYGGWCERYSKEPSEARFASFKSNYEQLSVANVAAAKRARDNGEERPADLKLNEFADMTVEEYLAAQNGSGGEAEVEAAAAEATGEEPAKGALETAMEATMAQADASRSLAEAAEALEAEEMVSL